MLKIRKDLNEYIMNTSHILFDYYDSNNKNTFVSPKNKSKKTVLDFFGKSQKKVSPKKPAKLLRN